MSQWIPVISLILGSVLTIVGGLLNERIKEDRVISREHENRQYNEAQDHRLYQAQIARELHDALRAAFKVVGAYWVTQEKDQTKKATPAERLEYLDVSTQIEILRERLADEQVRAQIIGIQERGVSVYNAKDGDEARKQWNEFQDSFADTVKALGPTARSAPPRTE